MGWGNGWWWEETCSLISHRSEYRVLQQHHTTTGCSKLLVMNKPEHGLFARVTWAYCSEVVKQTNI